jgi:hypothetical protein
MKETGSVERLTNGQKKATNPSPGLFSTRLLIAISSKIILISAQSLYRPALLLANFQLFNSAENASILRQKDCSQKGGGGEQNLCHVTKQFLTLLAPVIHCCFPPQV